MAKSKRNSVTKNKKPVKLNSLNAQVDKSREPKAAPKSGFLPGLAPVKDAAVQRAAEAYAEARDAKVAAKRFEDEKRIFLIDIMRKKGISVYRYGNIYVQLESKDKVKVRELEEDEDVGGEDEELTGAEREARVNEIAADAMEKQRKISVEEGTPAPEPVEAM